MKSDINYIIKRIIIGVAIGTILFNMKSCNVNAEVVNSTIYYNYAPLRCRLLNESTNGWGNGTLTQGISNHNYNIYWCKSSNASVSEFYNYEQLNLDRDATYNVYFKVFMEQTSTTIPIFDSDLSGIYFNSSTSVGSNTDITCEYTTTKYLTSAGSSGSLVNYQYDVVCKNVKINPDYGSFNIKINRPSSVITTISRSLKFESITTTDEIISSSNVDNALATFNGISLTNNNIVSSLVYIPIYFYNSIKSQLNTDSSTCNVISFSKSQLPLNSFINYDENGITLPCFRDLIENDLGFTYYETIGLVAGGCLIFVYVVRRGRGIIRMSSASNNDEDLWGGLS